MAACSIKLPAEQVVQDEVLEYRELIRALLHDVRRAKGDKQWSYARTLCFRVEYYDFPKVIEQLEGMLDAI
jgi:hypothetical protein